MARWSRPRNRIRDPEGELSELASAPDKFALASSARQEKAERFTKWRAALAKCYEKRDECNRLAVEVRRATEKRDEGQQEVDAALAVWNAFQSRVSTDDYDFQLPAEIEAERARGDEAREKYQSALRVR